MGRSSGDRTVGSGCLPFRRIGGCLEWLSLEFPVLLQENFDFAFRFLQLLASVVGKLDALFKEFKRLLEWNLSLLQLIHNFFKALKAFLKLGQVTPPCYGNSTATRESQGKIPVLEYNKRHQGRGDIAAWFSTTLDDALHSGETGRSRYRQ